MKVLSLCDGMSCGRIALERSGIPVEEYYASEIKDIAIKVTMAFLMAGMPVKYNCWTANRFDDFYTYADFAWDFNLEFIPKDRILTNFYMHYKQNENNHLWPMIAF